VLVSETVAELGATAVSAFEDLGVVQLKGLRDRVRVFRAIRATQ